MVDNHEDAQLKVGHSHCEDPFFELPFSYFYLMRIKIRNLLISINYIYLKC
jgi:hypothetical protein